MNGYNIECYDKCCAVEQYIALSDGEKRQYTDFDALSEYKSSKILCPCCVSYYSLYINGVLQPSVNYNLRKGFLTILTQDIPPKNAPIIIEFVSIFSGGCNICVKNDYFVAKVKKNQKMFTDDDALKASSTGGIPCANSGLLQRLFVNGTLQAPNLYTIGKGFLFFNTDNAPQENSIIILQTITLNP